MHLTFLTPLGAILAVGALAPLVALTVQGRRARRARRALRLHEPSRSSHFVTIAAIALIPVLLGIAAAQPVLQSTTAVRVRKDAEAFYIFDTSASMRAASARNAPDRLQRSLGYALRMRLALGNVRSGVATFTDRILPDLFPTSDEQVFVATLDQAVGIDAPPAEGLGQLSTTFAALDTLVGTNFFNPGVKHRLVIVFTDGETAQYSEGSLGAALHARPRTSFIFIHVSHPNERIYTSRGTNAYRPDPRSTGDVKRIASLSGGRAFGEGQIGDAISSARRMIGSGPTEELGEGLHIVALARWFALGALLPIAFLLWRRIVV